MRAVARPAGLRWVVLAALAAALLVLAHGCHGPDEDHELFTRWVLRL
jgi:hypothetical protein